MPSNQKFKIGAISVASAVAAVALGTEVIGGIALDTPYAYNALVVRENSNAFAMNMKKQY